MVMIKVFFKYYINPFFWASLMRRKYFVPDKHYRSILEVDISKLKKMKIKGIILDADNTLTEHHGASYPEGFENKIKQLRKDFKVCIVSNMLKKRRKSFRKNFASDIINCNTKKPAPEPFFVALKFLKTKPENTIVIGDRYLTDIVGAKRLGLKTIKVKPVDKYSEPLILRLERVFEELIYNVLK